MVRFNRKVGNKMRIGTHIKINREKLGLTQFDLAKKVGVTPVTISRYENGHRQANCNDFLSICEVLGINPNDFIEKEMRDK